MKNRLPILIATACAATILTITHASAATLVNDQFIDGDFVNGTDAEDVGWFTWNATNNTKTIVSDETTGPDEGPADNALNINPGTNGFRGVTGVVGSSFTLANTGDNITLRYDFDYTVLPNGAGLSNAGVRFGIYDSRGTVAADGGVNQNDDRGYFVRLSNGTAATAPTPLVEVWRETGGTPGVGSPTSTDTVLIAGGSGTGVTNVTDVYVRLSLSITRNAASGLDLVVQQGVNGAALTTIWSVTEAAGSVTSYTFDEIALGTGTNNQSFRVDNVLLTTAVPEPSTYASILVGFGLLIGSRRFIRKRSA